MDATSNSQASRHPGIQGASNPGLPSIPRSLDPSIPSADERAAAILRVLGQSPPGDWQTVRAIADAARLPITTTHKVLLRLHQIGVVRHRSGRHAAWSIMRWGRG